MKRVLASLIILFSVVNVFSQGVNIPDNTSGTTPIFHYNNNVGIGTDNPTGKLDVVYSTSAGNRRFKTYNNNGVRLQRTGDQSGWALDYGFLTNSGVNLGGFGGAGNDTGLSYFYIGESYTNNAMVIMDNTNIGIGTLDPNYDLEVDMELGNISFYKSGHINLFNKATVDKYWSISPRSNGNLEIASQTTDPNGSYIPASNSLLTILPTGEIGIGTTSPNTNILGSASYGYTKAIHVKHTNNARLILEGGASTIELIDNNGTTNQQVMGIINNDGKTWFRSRTDNLSTLKDNILVLQHNTGNVGIGTTNPGSYKLAVEGKIGAREVKVTTDSWADFVFADDYNLPTLNEVESYINENNHLPDVPSEKEVLKEGIELGEMNKILLQKIEELTLYIIEQEKRISELENTKNQ